MRISPAEAGLGGKNQEVNTKYIYLVIFIVFLTFYLFF